MKNFIGLIFFLTVLSSFSIAQEHNIVPFLKQIEQGDTKKAEQFLAAFGNDHKNPSIMFLEAVLTSDGESALEKYLEIYNDYPTSKFADASLFRVFSYYYSLGYYKQAESYLLQLKEFFPSSPYIKAADRNIPDEDLIVDKPSVPEASSPIQSASFTVQAGAFINLDNARRLKQNLEGDKLKCDIRNKEVGGTILNIVLVGQYSTREETESVLAFLKEKYKINGRVASFDQYN